MFPAGIHYRGCGVSGAPSVRAGEIPIDISALANEPWTYVGPNDFLIINGSTFPTGAQSFGGIPFAIPSGPNNYWAAAAAANFRPGTVSLTIPVDVSGVTSFFTLLNTMWGWASAWTARNTSCQRPSPARHSPA
jgi:hypothetical protein